MTVLLHDWPNLTPRCFCTDPFNFTDKHATWPDIPLQDIEDCAIRGDTSLRIFDHVVDIIRVAPDIAMADYKGTTVQHASLEYNEKHVLGQGGYATVYKGVYKGREAAIKKLHMTSEMNPKERSEKFREFRDEIILHQKLRHPCIVELFCICVDPFCVTMEYIPLGDLHTHLHELSNPIEWMLMLKLATDIARGVQYLHGKSIIRIT